MSIVPPPSCNPAIFNPACFETTTTISSGGIVPTGDYVEYPTAQGDITLQGVDYQGFATFSNEVYFKFGIYDSLDSFGQDGQVLTASSGKVLWTFQGSSAVPIGTIMGYVGTSIPEEEALNWAFCDGSLLDIATYGQLYAVIGTTYNTGTITEGYFKLPNMLGRMPIGSQSINPLTGVVVDGGSSNTTYNASIYGGNQLISVNQIPEHTHYIGWGSDNGNFLDGFNKTSNTTTGGGSDRVVNINETDLPNNTTIQEPFYSTPTQNQSEILSPFISMNWIIRAGGLAV
jgi:microcystin-dependent protein